MRTKDINERIADLEGGSIIFSSDFLNLCTERQAVCVLTWLEAKGEIERWRADYVEMQRNFLFGDVLPFDDLLDRMNELRKRFRSIV